MARPASWLPNQYLPFGYGPLDRLLRLRRLSGTASSGAPLSPSDGLAGPSMTGGLLSESLWRRPLDHDGANAASPPESRSRRPAPIARELDGTNFLPDAVVNLFRESLDDEGLGFLKHGPRSSGERLAFAQRVHPDAHLSSSAASATEQSRFQESGTFDSNRYFVGPDRRVYLRGSGTKEPLAYRLRRGIESAVGGFQRPELAQIIEASLLGAQGGPGSARFEEKRSQAQSWPGTTLAREDSSMPLPPRIPEVKGIYSKLRQIERDVREQGLTVGADALKHFMDGGGLPVQYDQTQFRSFPVVQEAEHSIQKHFVDWMLGTHPKRAVIAGKAPGGPHDEQAVGDDRDSVLPDAVVNSFHGPLDAAGLHFLKHGPRSIAQQLAFAQAVHPDAYRSAPSAPETEQSRFRQIGTFDHGRYFAGPDRRLYVRTETASEPLAYRLRRGIEKAVGGYDRPDLPEIIEASSRPIESISAAPHAPQLREVQGSPLGGAAVKDTGMPLPPRIPAIKSIDDPEIRGIYDKFRRVERDVREQGLTVGADALRHFMEGAGMPIQYDHAEFRRFPVVQEAEKGVQKHFVNWMLGTHPKRAVAAGRSVAYVDSGLEQIKDDLVGMKDGDTLIRGSHWDAEFPYPKLTRFAVEATVGEPSPDANLYGATGDAMLRSDGGFTFHRKGDQIEFKGAVEHNFDERFEFELDDRLPFYAPAKGSNIPWEITQEAGVATQDHGLGTPFTTSARWFQPVSGVLTVDGTGALRLDHVEWGEARPRQTRPGM